MSDVITFKTIRLKHGQKRPKWESNDIYKIWNLVNQLNYSEDADRNVKYYLNSFKDELHLTLSRM